VLPVVEGLKREEKRRKLPTFLRLIPFVLPCLSIPTLAPPLHSNSVPRSFVVPSSVSRERKEEKVLDNSRSISQLDGHCESLVRWLEERKVQQRKKGRERMKSVGVRPLPFESHLPTLTA
jgi:hypothetical protein